MVRFWVTVDAKPTSTVDDCVFATSAEGFVLQVLGGLSNEQHPQVHATRSEALEDAISRCTRTEMQYRALHDRLSAALGESHRSDVLRRNP